MERGKTFTFESFGEKMQGALRLNKYANNNALVVELAEWVVDGKYWGDYGRLSVNVPESASLPPDEFAAKNYSENEGLVEQLLAQGIFEDTGRTISAGYVEGIPILKLNDKARSFVLPRS